jgi:hypothetical protein
VLAGMHRQAGRCRQGLRRSKITANATASVSPHEPAPGLQRSTFGGQEPIKGSVGVAHRQIRQDGPDPAR